MVEVKFGATFVAAEPAQRLEGFEEVALIRRSKKPSVRSSLQVVDLFCGAGGLSLGLELAGFQSVLGVDVWAPATETFAHHHQTANVLRQDLRVLSPAS